MNTFEKTEQIFTLENQHMVGMFTVECKWYLIDY